jgi:hypothetical protein
MADVKVGTLYYQVELRGAEDVKRQAQSLGGMAGGAGVGGGSGSRGGGASGAPMAGGSSFNDQLADYIMTGGASGRPRDRVRRGGSPGRPQVEGVRGEDSPPAWGWRYGGGTANPGGGGGGSPGSASSPATPQGSGYGGGGGFFGMPGGRRLAMQAMFGAWEVGRAFTASTDFDNPMLNRSAQQTMHTQSSAIQRMGGGILGAVARGGIDVADAISPYVDGVDVGGRTSAGYGLLGRYSPRAMEAAQSQAMAGLEAVSAKTRGYAKELGIRRDVSGIEAQATNMGIRSPYSRRIAEARSEYSQSISAIDDEGRVLNQRAADNSGPMYNAEEDAKIRAEMNVYNRTSPLRRTAAAHLRDAQEAETKEDRALFIEQTNRGANAGLQAARGFGPEAAHQGVNAKYLPGDFDAQGNPHRLGKTRDTDAEYGAVYEAYQTEHREVDINTEKGRNLQRMRIEGNTKAYDLQAGFKPLQAQVEAIKDSYTEQVQSLSDVDRNSPNIDKIRGEGQAALKAFLANYLAAGQAVQGSIFSDTTGGQTGSEQIGTLIETINKAIEALASFTPTLF